MFTSDDVMKVINELPRDKSNPVGRFCEGIVTWDLTDEKMAEMYENGTGTEICLYTQVDKDGNTNHCIAGEVIHRLGGYDLPFVDSRDNWNSVDDLPGIENYYEPLAIETLSIAQGLADSYSTNPGGDREIWGMVIDEMNVENSDINSYW